MFKRIATILLVGASVGSTVFPQAKSGGFARQASMGGSNFGAGVVLNPFVMEDPAWMYIDPSYQVMYKDYTWSNIGGGTVTSPGTIASTGDNGYGLQNAGISFAVNKELTVGVILSHDPSGANAVRTMIGGTILGVPILNGGIVRARAPQAIPPIANVWEAVGSYSAGGLDVGVGIMYGNSNRDSTATTAAPFPVGSFESEASASMVGIRGGVYYDLGGGSAVHGTVAFRLDKATDFVKTNVAGTVANLGEYSASGTELSVVARAKLKVSNKVNFVPYGVLAILSADPKEDAQPTGLPVLSKTVTVSGLSYAVGAGGEYRTPSVFLAGGLSFQSVRVKTEAGDTIKVTQILKYTALPVVNVGGEIWFLDWLGARAGYFRSIGSVKTEIETRGLQTEGNTTFPNSFVFLGGLGPATWDGVVTMGLGFKFGNFALDATVSDEALRRGLGLIGAQDNINTFGYLTASYNFQ